LIEAENQKTDRAIPFNLSIGVATAVHGVSLSECLKEADHMMYENKTSHHKRA